MQKLMSTKLPFGHFSILDEKPDFDTVHCHQVHGDKLISTTSCGDEADGIISTFDELIKKPWLIKTADCLPVVIKGNKGICFLHAGWRGLAQKILTQKKIHELEPTFAYIGPSISSRSFEVSADFAQNFPNSAHFFHNNGKFFFDLQAFAREELKKLNPQIEIWDSQTCTYESKTLASYRRNKDGHRNWNILSINEVMI